MAILFPCACTFCFLCFLPLPLVFLCILFLFLPSWLLCLASLPCFFTLLLYLARPTSLLYPSVLLTPLAGTHSYEQLETCTKKIAHARAHANRYAHLWTLVHVIMSGGLVMRRWAPADFHHGEHAASRASGYGPARSSRWQKKEPGVVEFAGADASQNASDLWFVCLYFPFPFQKWL